MHRRAPFLVGLLVLELVGLGILGRSVSRETHHHALGCATLARAVGNRVGLALGAASLDWEEGDTPTPADRALASLDRGGDGVRNPLDPEAPGLILVAHGIMVPPPSSSCAVHVVSDPGSPRTLVVRQFDDGRVVEARVEPIAITPAPIDS